MTNTAHLEEKQITSNVFCNEFHCEKEKNK